MRKSILIIKYAFNSFNISRSVKWKIKNTLCVMAKKIKKYIWDELDDFSLLYYILNHFVVHIRLKGKIQVYQKEWYIFI